jgi:hypothetical protein
MIRYGRNVMDNLNFEVPELVDSINIKYRNILQLRFGRRSWVEHGSDLGRFGVLWGGPGGQEVCFLMVNTNFEVPGAVDNEISRTIAKVVRS